MADSNSPQFIVYVSGKRCSGKTYVCRWLSENVPSCVMFEPMALLRRMYVARTRVSLDELTRRDTKETHRAAMFNYYTAPNRQLFDNVIIDKIRALDPMPRFVLIDMCRSAQRLTYDAAFPSARYIHLRVFASDETRVRRGWARSTVDDDITERELDAFYLWLFSYVENDTDDDRGCMYIKDLFSSLPP